MCGIVAATAQRDIAGILLDGLKALEYRGYDSAGLCVLVDGQLARLRAHGKVSELESLYRKTPLMGHTGISHTRWATHGVPNEMNAHPHVSSDKVAIVHNGIIENFSELRGELIAQGYKFDTDTDTEVIAHLLQSYIKQGKSLLQAMQASIKRLRGAYAFAAVCASEPGIAVGARSGNPLLVGLGQGENFLASDVQALIKTTKQFIYLEEGDVVEISPTHAHVYDADGTLVTRPVKQSELTADAVERGKYRHYMLKEIFEQPVAVASTLEGRIAGNRVLPNILGVDADKLLSQVDHVQIVACGTSYHAGLVARYWIEEFAGISCSVEVASEYRYRHAVVPPNTLFIAISQSGETADTLAAMREGKKRGYMGAVAICNVPESTLVRESNLVLMTRAGPEIGVASTKAFTTQLVALALLTLELGRCHGLESEKYKNLINELTILPRVLSEVLELQPQITILAERFVNKQHALFLGRGLLYPVAMEAALKLKEISYIHAEAYPAGELKHGPLALVDESMPVIAVAPNDQLLEKLKSNLEAVRARGGELFVFADNNVNIVMDDRRGNLLKVASGGQLIDPIIFTVPLQLLAYHVAILRGTDVDQPRNLAKSVTVE